MKQHTRKLEFNVRVIPPNIEIDLSKLMFLKALAFNKGTLANKKALQVTTS